MWGFQMNKSILDRDKIKNFDPVYYTENNPDVAGSGLDPLEHYINYGQSEGRLPRDPLKEDDFFQLKAQENSLLDFDPIFYLANYPDVKASKLTPLEHYIAFGKDEGRYKSDKELFLAQAAGLEDVISKGIIDIIQILEPNRTITNENYLKKYVLYMFSEKYYRNSASLESNQSRAQLLVHFIISGIPNGKSPGPLFDTEYYLDILEERGILIDLDRSSPFEHWLSYGVEKRISPTPLFSEKDYIELNNDLIGYPGWVFDHFLLYGIDEGRKFNNLISFSRGFISYTYVNQRFGLRKFLDEVTNEVDVKNIRRIMVRKNELVKSDTLKRIFLEACSIDPEVGSFNRHLVNSLIPPFHDQNYQDYDCIRRLIPEEKFDFIILMPFCKLGGADYVAGIVSKVLTELGSTLILRTEQSDWERPDWFPSSVVSIDISDHLNILSEANRSRVLYEIIISKDARNIININSKAGFQLFEEFGKQLSWVTRLHSYYFCSDRDRDGIEVGYPIWFFSTILKYLTSAIMDNKRLRDQLCERYNLPDIYSSRVHTVYTPASNSTPLVNVAEKQVESKAQRSRPVILWAGRLDKQKRFDIVIEIAKQMPGIDFKCWGKPVLDEAPNLNQMPSNVSLHPPFKSIEDLPLINADGWLYTSEWDGLPTILIECAAFGMPIVASAVGGVPELIDEDTGWPVYEVNNIDKYVEALGDMLKSDAARIDRAISLQKRVKDNHQFRSYQPKLSSIIIG
jgi:glycosyltransferase involved in cell wall biosynthesis